MGDAVESALSQTHPAVEVIVVDDGSTDATADVVERFGDRVLLIRQENAGLASARAAGMRIARGRYIAWLDADDVAHPRRAAWQEAVARAHPEVVLIGSDFNVIDLTGQRRERQAHEHYAALATPERFGAFFPRRATVAVGDEEIPVLIGDVRARLTLANFIHPPTVFLPREAFERAGPPTEGPPIAQDWMYFVRLSRLGPFAIIDAPLLDYRLSEAQMSSRAHRGPEIARENLEALERLMDQNRDLVQLDPDAYDRRLASMELDLADALSESDPREALRHWARSLRRGSPRAAHLKMLLKALLPAAALRWARTRKSG